MKFGFIIFLVGFVIIISSLVGAETNFSGAEDVDKRASFDMIIINLNISTQGNLSKLQNESYGYRINYTLQEIPYSRALSIKNPKQWIWYNGTFKEIVPIIFRDKYIENVAINLTDSNSFKLDADTLLFSPYVHDGCYQLQLNIKINNTKIKEDYPDFEFYDIQFTSPTKTFPIISHDQKNGYTSNTMEICSVLRTASIFTSTYPLETYNLTLQVWGLYPVPDKNKSIGDISGNIHSPESVSYNGEVQIYWGQFASKNPSLMRGDYNITFTFEDFNINIYKFRPKKWPYLIVLITSLLLHLSYYLYLRHITTFTNKVVFVSFLELLNILALTPWAFYNASDFVFTLSIVPFGVPLVLILGYILIKRLNRRVKKSEE